MDKNVMLLSLAPLLNTSHSPYSLYYIYTISIMDALYDLYAWIYDMEMRPSPTSVSISVSANLSRSAASTYDTMVTFLFCIY